jgi:hypothetical protein
MVSSVIPAKAGIQKKQALLDPGACPGPRSGIRRGDDFEGFLRDRLYWAVGKSFCFSLFQWSEAG